ncbi:hypothetical protein ACW7FY_13835, partial [Bacillus subtilis]
LLSCVLVLTAILPLALMLRTVLVNQDRSQHQSQRQNGRQHQHAGQQQPQHQHTQSQTRQTETPAKKRQPHYAEPIHFEQSAMNVMDDNTMMEMLEDLEPGR